MSLPEGIFLLILQLHWRNILLLNAYDEGSTCLVWMLSNVGKPVTVVEYQEMDTYTWPERLDLKPRTDGQLILAENQTNLMNILSFLQSKHLIAPNRLWIIAVQGPLRLNELLKEFNEGDRALVLENNAAKSDFLCPDFRGMTISENVTGDTFKDMTLWTLRSPGNGSILFENRDLYNLSASGGLFDRPFRNFRGRTLKISSLASPPIRIPPKEGKQRWGGYIFCIINTLADVFNFSYTVKDADLYGIAQEDGTWTGLIGELIRKSVDLGAGDISWTLERFQVIDLTKPVFPETVTFIYRAPEHYSRTWILFQGIHPKVWIAMLSATVGAFAAYFLALSLHRIWRHYVEDPTTVCIQSADESISSLYRGLLGKGVVNVPFTVSSRTVLGAWFVASLILSALYGGSLTSKLSLHKSPKPADSLKELLKRHPDANLAFRNNSQIHHIFRKSEYWNKVWLKNMQNNAIPGRISIADTMVRVHNSSDNKAPYVWMAERSMLVKLMQKYSNDPVVCDLYVAKEDIVKSDWSITLQRDSPFLAQFNEMITRMWRFGLLERWRREFWEAPTGSCHPTDGLNESGQKPISLEDTRAIFIVLAIGWAVGIATLVAERQYCNRFAF